MSFRTKLDYSDNRQIKQRERTSTILSGTTVFGVPFSGLTNGVDYSTTGITDNDVSVFGSTFSGNATTTVFTWVDPRMSVVDTYLSAITPSNSAQTQDSGVVLVQNQTTSVDGNPIVLSYSGVSLIGISVTAMTETSSGNYTGATSIDEFDVYSASSLDYTGRTIWSDCKEISRTKKLIITENPSAGLVWTCANDEGLGSWEAVSGITSGMSATTYNNLSSAISSSALIAGKFYKFAYNTKHLIGGTTAEYNDTSVHYDDGTGVKSTLTAETENFLVLAIAGNKIHTEVYSEQYPNDIIYYDVSDNLTEDGLQARPGFITYREDTVNNISAHYDWRNVIHRRFDMDPSDTGTGRTADYKTMIGFVATSNANHPIKVGSDLIPGFANFSAGGHADIGAMNTHTEGTFRDFKTFVGMGADIYGTESPRFINIHIDNSESQASINTGSPYVGATTLTSSIYGKIANVVFFTKSAENVRIGKNASGVMFTGAVIKEVNIGDSNQNIIIGASLASPTYAGITATTKNFSENIVIGANNRNVLVSSGVRRLKIGSSNTGVVFHALSSNNTLGSYNTLVYSYYANNNKLGDWMTNIRISNSHNINLGSECSDIDLVKNWEANPYVGDVSATFPNGFGAGTTTKSVYADRGISIGPVCKKMFITSSNSSDIGANCENIILWTSPYVKIGPESKNITTVLGQNLTIGNSVQDVEINGVANANIGNRSTQIKILQGTQGATISNIGEFCSNILISSSQGDTDIGSACTGIFLSGVEKIKIGDYNSNIVARGSSQVDIGSKNNDIFLEFSVFTKIGNNNSDIALADVGKVFLPGYPSFASYSFRFDNAIYGRAYNTATTFLTGSTAPTSVFNDWNLSLGARNGVGLRGCSRTVIGDNCEEVFIVDSNDCVIGSNNNNVIIGCDTTYSNSYTLGNTNGYMNSIDLSAVTATTVLDGRLCHETVVGSNCDNIKVIGTSQSGNTFGSNVSDVTVVSGYTFTDNRILVDGAPVTTSASYKGKVYNKSTDIGGRWEESIVNSATTSGLLVSGSEYKITEYIPATSGTTISGKTYEILDIATATSGATISGQTYEILDIATATSGATISGQTYQIIDYNSGDSFINVGASSNATGVVFTATGTAPTNWTNGSKLTADDFINVGASSNATGVVFTATGTTPTNWTNGSELTADDFTNVGASANSNGVTFTATGTTPTNWTNGSKVAVDDFTNVGASSNTTGVIFTATGTTPNNWITSSVVTNFEAFTVLPITRLK